MVFSLKYKGFDYVAFYNGAYENSSSLPSLLSTGANSIEATLDYGIDAATSQVVADPNYTDSLAALGTTIAQAESLGLSVMVRPLIDFLNPAESAPYSVGDWRQDYVPTNTAAFFASYQKMIVAEATVAQQNGAQMLSIGAELDQLAGPQYLSYWTSIISAVHEVFSGKLTYSASWNTASQVSFWSQLDYEGIDCYVPLSNAAHPTLQNLINGWTLPATQAANPGAFAVIGNQSPIQYFENLAIQSGKPLLFTELGYANDSGAAANPSASGNSPDPTLQAELYQAFFKAWAQSGSSSLVGAYFWEWDPNGSTTNVGPGIDSFSPQNSAAQSSATAGFSVPVVTLTGTGGAVDISDQVISGSVDLADVSGSIQLFENNQPIGGLLAVSAQGTFSTTIHLPTDGTYTIVAEEANVDGVIGTSNSITFNLSSPPTVSITSAGGAIDVSDQVVSGTVDLADASGSVQLFENSQPIGAPVAVSADGAFSTTIHLPTDGIYTIGATETNAEGFVGTSNSITFDLSAPPTVAITTTGGTIDVSDQVVSGTVDLADASGSVQLFENGQPLGAPVSVSAEGVFSTTIHLPADGIYTIGATETNAEGFVGTSNSITFDLSSPPSLLPDIAGNNDEWILANGQWSASAGPGSHPAGYEVASIGDFTGNGTSDILWYNSSTGDVDEWKMSNAAWNGSVDLGAHPGAGWQIVGSGDFAGNGTDDVLWTNSTGGQVQTDIWMLQNGQWSSSVSPGTHPGGYQVAGIGDFTGNGTSDILWFNPTTGDADEWQIANGKWVGSVDLGSHPGSGWQIAGVGNFTGNGTDDILWTNSTGGQVQTDIWELQNGKWVASVSPGNHPAGYQVAGIGDFTGKGTSGILWQNPNTGDVDEWQLTNGKWAASVDLGEHPGSGWKLAGVGDVTGSGVSDLIWHTG